jgi:hypothetical protein
MGVTLDGEGFRMTPDEARQLGYAPGPAPAVVRRYLLGRDLAQKPEERLVIDFCGLDERAARAEHPALYQRLRDRVFDERQQNKRRLYRDRWWVFGEAREGMRAALESLPRFIATGETARHRFFVFLGAEHLADHKLYVVASDDAAALGTLSSRVHVAWALAAGGRLGVGNDPTWTNSTCFLPFPFPACTDAQAARIRDLGEQLDAHRKRQQAAHPGLTITGMYNVLEKLRREEALTDKERAIHEQGLVSVLRQIHDDLDAAVLDAYGWPRDLTDEQILERLVALNAERAEEERKGLVRWLRPDFQNPAGARPATQETLATGDEAASDDDAGAAPAAPAAARPWPKKLGERIAGVRELFAGSKRLWTTAEVASAFKGAKKADVEDLLEGLAGIGAVVATGAAKSRRWGAAARG